MVLQQQKLKLLSARKGHDLLKKKSDALAVKFRAILSQILEVCYSFLAFAPIFDMYSHRPSTKW